MTRAFACALTVAVVAARPAIAADETRITNASNVRLRIAPSTDAPISAELRLGTELEVVASSGGADPWYHVRTADRRDGWVSGALTTALDPARREQIVESIVEARLRSTGNFIESTQLVDFIERSTAKVKDRETLGRFALYRLRALGAIFRIIPDRIGNRGAGLQLPDVQPYGSWILGHLNAAVYNELGGGWMVNPEYVRAMHDRHSGTVAADEIGWFYATNGLLGECEGNVPCYVAGVNKLDGWYLRSYPNGQHADV